MGLDGTRRNGNEWDVVVWGGGVRMMGRKLCPYFVWSLWLPPSSFFYFEVACMARWLEND